MKVDKIDDALVIMREDDLEKDKIKHFVSLAMEMQNYGIGIVLGELRDEKDNFIGFYLEVPYAETFKQDSYG